jgi:hypothetical protein
LNLVFQYQDGKQHTWGPNDIQGFIFGGYGSRFWILKNYINSKSPQEIKPNMLSWNMISLKITKRDKFYDLIIQDQEQMDVLIQFLLQMIHQRNTIGRMTLASEKISKKYQFRKEYIPKKMKVVEQKIATLDPDFSQGLKLYRFIRIRQKISYMAWAKKKSLKHLLFQQIYDSYFELNRQKIKDCIDFNYVLGVKSVRELLRNYMVPKTGFLIKKYENKPENIFEKTDVRQISENHKKIFNNQTENMIQEFMKKHDTNKLYCRVIIMMAMGPFSIKCKDPLIMLQLLLQREINFTQ